MTLSSRMGEQLHTTPILYNRDNHQFLGETTQGFLRKFLYNMHFFCFSCKISFVGCPLFTKYRWYTLQFHFSLGGKRAFGTFRTHSNDSSAHTPINLTLILLQAHTSSYTLCIITSYKNILSVHITYSAQIYLKIGKSFNSLCSSHNNIQFSIHFTKHNKAREMN